MSDVLAPECHDRPTRLAAPPSFTIAIPAYQAAATLGDAVASALGQVHPPAEIVVVDDGSTDDVEGVLCSVSDQVTLIRKENGGGASALNAAAAIATADFLAVLDADDAYNPRRLEVLARLAMERPDLDIVTTDSRLVLGGGEVGRFSDYNTFDVDDQRSAILESCFIGGWPAVRLSRLRAIGGWDERMRIAYDWDCWLRLIFAGARAGLVTDAYHDYRVDSGGLTAGRRLALWERVRLLEKAQAELQLSPPELEVLRRSLRRHRTRAVQSDIEAGLTGTAPRRRLLQHALSAGIDPRARAKSALAAAAPGLARRFVSSEPVPEERLRARS